jgi:type IV pilus assembly protein PilN
MRIRLNLATKAQETHRRFMVVAGLVAAIAGIIFLALGWHVYSIRNVDARLRAQSEITERFFAQPENAKLHDRAAFLNSLIDGRSFNWTQMFMDLERILPGGVKLVSIEPKQAKGHVEVKLTVGASSDDAKLKFLRALEDSRQFTDIQLDTDMPARNGTQRVVALTAIYSRS